jgi:hypothetical protein
MDPLISKLNEAVLSQIETPKGFAQAPKSEPSSFQSTMDEKWMERMKEMIVGDFGEPTQINAVSADDIKIESVNNEVKVAKSGEGDAYFDMFKKLNKDMIGLDNAVETLMSPGNALSPKQLLALQAGVAQVSLYAEAFSKLTDTVARDIQTVVQTQV